MLNSQFYLWVMTTPLLNSSNGLFLSAVLQIKTMSVECMSEEDKNLSIHVTKMINDNYFKTGFLLEEEILRFFASLDMKLNYWQLPPLTCCCCQAWWGIRGAGENGSGCCSRCWCWNSPCTKKAGKIHTFFSGTKSYCKVKTKTSAPLICTSKVNYDRPTNRRTWGLFERLQITLSHAIV